MAARTANSPYRDIPPHPKDATAVAVVEVPKDKVKEVAARLMAHGYKQKQIAEILLDHLITPAMAERPKEQKMKSARTKLKRWETQQSFRDMVYQTAMIELDLESPAIIRGVAKKARAGRVDAARFLFELTGRHNPKGDTPPAQIAVVINGMPRPKRNNILEDAANVQAVEASDD